MILNSKNITDCNKQLQDIWKRANLKWNILYPESPVNPILTQTFRSKAIQEVYYMQGRNSLSIINSRRKEIGLYILKATENKIITNAKAGQSKHNAYPSEAFDIAFIRSDTKKLDWSEINFINFGKIVKEISKNEIICGGDWKKFRDLPHFETK